MINIKELLSNSDKMKSIVHKRNINADVDALIALYEKLKTERQKIEQLRGEANRIAKNMPQASKNDRDSLIAKGIETKKLISAKQLELEDIDKEYQAQILCMPNWQPDDTPVGNDDTSNIVIKTVGTPKKFDFSPQDHLQLAKSLDLLDFERGSKVAGSKFYFLKNDAVLLEMAIIQYTMQKAAKHGYIMLQTPDLARNNILLGAGFNPRGNESNTYLIENHDLSLVATSEIAVGGAHANEIFNKAELPLKYVALSHCFRTEAGAAGKASKGLYRVHQFSKIELYQFTTPENSEQALEDILALEESIYQDLEIPYQVLRICAGDMGAPAYKKYDIEAWMPGKGDNGEYGEITSASNCTDFQSRRLNIRYKNIQTNSNDFVHTLNGTAAALSRCLIAILENHQTKTGEIYIPTILQPFMGKDKICIKT